VVKERGGVAERSGGEHLTASHLTAIVYFDLPADALVSV